MKTISNFLILGTLALVAPKFVQAQTLPNSSIEYADGPSGKLDLGEIKDIKSYAFNANTSIKRLLNTVEHMSDSEEIKKILIRGIDGKDGILASSTDKRSVLLLTNSLQSGMTLVKMIDLNTIKRGIAYTPQGTVDQQNRIMKQSLIFARDYYQSDFEFINGVLAKNEAVTNPKFVEFGLKMTQFLIKMSDGVLSARGAYGMIRWSLAVLANDIKNDKEIGIAYAATQANLVKTLLSRDEATGLPNYPDLVNGEMAPEDVDCIAKIRELKLLAQQSFDEITDATKTMIKK